MANTSKRAQRQAARQAKRRRQLLLVGAGLLVVLVVVAAVILSGRSTKANTVTTASGLQYQVLQTGSGPQAQAGDVVSVNYVGTLTDGTQFDSSYDRGQPFTFPLGQGNVIPGWDEGVAGMQVGEKRKLIIPPDLGYGANGAGGVIPPNATLIFEVELMDIQ